MIFLIVVGSIIFVVGAMLLFLPKGLQKANQAMAKILLDIDKFIFKNRVGAGISLVLTGACLWFIAYYIQAVARIKGLY